MEQAERHLYKINDERISGLIKDIAHSYGSGFTEQLLNEMLVTIAKIGEEKLDSGDMKLINTTLKELRYAFKVFSSYRNRRKVAVFGSARCCSNTKEYKMAELFSREITKNGFLVITGSGPGIMEAGNKGAGRANSFGVNIRVPFEQKPNQYIINDSKLINFKYFFTRKLIFIKESDATVLFPGGFGTLDEGFEAITLFQTGKCRPRPIILLEPKNGTYWKKWLSFVKTQMLKYGYISKEDLSIFKIMNSPEEAIKEILFFYKNYNSIRYINNDTVIRLNNDISSKILSKINSEFKDIFIGNIVKTNPLKEEVLNNEHLELPRLKMCFNRHDFGRLKQLINRINSSY